MVATRRWWQPPYELHLVVDDPGRPPLLVWSRHWLRVLALYNKRLEESPLDLGRGRLVVHDRRGAEPQVRGRSRRVAGEAASRHDVKP